VKAAGWTEHRPIASVVAPGVGVVEWREGDFVMVVVVRRFEDCATELAKLAGRELELLETRSSSSNEDA